MDISHKAADKMYELICSDYSSLIVLNSFNIPFGLGDKTIKTVCAENNIDLNTFLAIINLLFKNRKTEVDTPDLEMLMNYLCNSHSYFLSYRLPLIRNNLTQSLSEVDNDLLLVILRFFDEYVDEVCKHMKYEEDTVFPYIRSLINEENDIPYSIKRFAKRHDKLETKLSELKDIIIKYYPTGVNNQLTSVLYDIFACSDDLAKHNMIEDKLLIPAVYTLEEINVYYGK